MIRALTFAVVLPLLGCSGEALLPVIVDTSDTGEALGPLRESRVRVFATFRYDAATGLPGPWLNESSGQSTSAIDFVVADDRYDGVNGTWCHVYVPISAEGATAVSDLGPDVFWGVTLDVDPARVTTNCDEPEYARINDFYRGEVVEFLTTNRDGSPVEFGVFVGSPSPDAVAWLAGGGPQVEEQDVIGGGVRLSDKWAYGRVDSIAALAHETDENGLLVIDEEGSNQSIPLSEVFVDPGIREAVYELRGYRYMPFVRSP